MFAARRWRGIDTLGVRESIAAINGIGHAAVACDPRFRTVLAAHGYTLDSAAQLGYRDRDQPISLAPTLAGQLDRDKGVVELLRLTLTCRRGRQAMGP